MAKKNKGHLDGADAAKAALIALGADFVARMVTQLSKEGISWLSPGTLGGAAAGGTMSGGDPTRTVLKALADDGPQGVEELMEHTGVGIGPLLTALQGAREFKLIDFDKESMQVSLTDAGRRIAHSVRKGGIREAADRMLA